MKGDIQMQIVIDIPEEMIRQIKHGMWCGNNIISDAIENGTVLPKRHGRLVDADALDNTFFHLWTTTECVYALRNAPTVLEADKEV